MRSDVMSTRDHGIITELSADPVDTHQPTDRLVIDAGEGRYPTFRPEPQPGQEPYAE
jgi:hypothetical protein